MTTEAERAPLESAPLADMTIGATAQDVVAPAPGNPPAAAPPKKSWREERWERRRRRVWFEEILGWILVPLIVVSLYYIVVALLGALGTSPSAIINGLSVITSNL
jgi:hypothetical protein